MHDSIDTVAKEDYKYIVEEPDKDFNPERNYKIIEQVIQEGIKVSETLKAAQRKETEQRADILATYARHALGGGQKTLKQFVGSTWMNKLYGEKLLDKIRIMDSIERLNKENGNTKYEDYYLT